MAGREKVCWPSASGRGLLQINAMLGAFLHVRTPCRAPPLTPALAATVTGGRLELTAEGPWTARHASALEGLIEAAPIASAAPKAARIDLAKVGELDTFGAWLLERLMRACRQSVPTATFVGVPERYRGLLDEVAEVNRRPPASARRGNRLLATFEDLGRTIAATREEAGHFAGVLGALAAAFLRALRNPRTFRMTSAVYQLDRVGWQAIGIILLITFLIGCIIAQQGFFHFRKFGAERLRRRSRWHPRRARDRGADRRHHGGGAVGQLLHRRARLDEDARGARRAAHHGARSRRCPDAAARAGADPARFRS